MNTDKKYLVNKLLEYTNKHYSLLKTQAPQEELHFFPVGVLLMKWICDSKERYEWNVSKDTKELFSNNLIYNRFYNEENCNKELYDLAKEFEKSNPILQGILTSLCFTYIDYIKPEHIKEMFINYSEFQFTDEYTEKEVMGPFIELFLQNLNDYFRFGSFVTPKPVKVLLAKLFSSHECMSLADITSGTCSILTEVVKQFNLHGLDINKIRIYGQEINYKVALIGRLNLLLHGVKQPDIEIKDSLREPISLGRRKTTKFDVILANLPLGIKWDPHEIGYKDEIKYNYPSKMFADWIFVQRGLAALGKMGKAAFILSKGTLTRNTEISVRKNFIMEDLIESVISLPSNLYGSKSMPIEILIINKSKELNKKNKILFIDASKEYYKKERGKNDLSSKHIEEILKTYHNWHEIANYSKVVDVSIIENNSFNLDSSLYLNSREVCFEEGKVKKLKDVAEVKRGLQIQKKEISKLVKDNGTHYYIKISDINDGNIDFNEKIRGLSESKISLYELKPKDIIISARGTLIKTAIYEENMPPSIISGNIMIIRLKKEYNPYFLKFYLDSSKGKELIKDMQGGSTITALNQSKLQELLIPDINKERQDKLAQRINENEANYKSIIEHAKKMYEQNIDIINNEIFNYTKK